MKQSEGLIKRRIEENYNDANLELLDKHIEQGNLKYTSYRLVDRSSAPCKVKITKKSQEICARTILK